MSTVLTERQRVVLDGLRENKSATQIAQEHGVSRNAVYQQIQRLRKNGVLPPEYTPTGTPIREDSSQPGARMLSAILDSLDTNGESEQTQDLALNLAMEELREVRDQLDTLSRRISKYIPR